MQVTEVAPDVLVFCAPTYESVATAFLSNGEALLVDALASADEALALRAYLERERHSRVRRIVVSHYMDDHVAGLGAFPDAEVIAHRMYAFTHALGRTRRTGVVEFRAPDRVVDRSVDLVHGPHRVHVFHNPGKTVCMLNVDVPESDLTIAADNVISRLPYLSSSVPELLDDALTLLQGLARRIVVAGHQGAFDASALADARIYLANLRERVQAARLGADGDPDHRVLEVACAQCFSPSVDPTPFERQWHAENLCRVVERKLFWTRYPTTSSMPLIP
jgi:cyclase